MVSNKTEFYHSTIWTENGVLFGRYAPDLVIDINVARDMVADRKKFTGNVFWAMFADATDFLSMDNEARQYLSGKEACEFLTAGVIFGGNKLLELIGTAWVSLDKPAMPTAVFGCRACALHWLEPYVAEALILNQGSK